MKRATVVQIIAMVCLVWSVAFFIVWSHHQPPTITWRPATEQERQRHDADLLREEMDRLWQQRQQQEAGATPTPGTTKSPAASRRETAGRAPGQAS